MKKLLVNFLNKNVFGKRKFQPFFEKLYYYGTIGQNIGNGYNPQLSGEYSFFDFLAKKIYVNNVIPVVFDIGANKGYYALELINILKRNNVSDYKVYCFEPSNVAYEYLVKELNGQNNVSFFKIGISDKSGITKLYGDFPGYSSATMLQYDSGGVVLKDYEEIELQTLDSFMATNKVDHVHFLKIDTEGLEYAAMMGAKESIQNQKFDIIQFEFGGSNVFSKVFLRDFYEVFDGKYHFFRLLKDGLRSLGEHSFYNENFLCTNFIAISDDCLKRHTGLKSYII